MPEQIKKIQQKIVEFWNKWTAKQKTIIISSFVGVVVLIGVIVFLLGRTTYTELYKFNTIEGASNAISTLKAGGIASKLDNDKLTVLVDEDKYVDAIVAVSSANIEEEGFSIDKMLDTSLTTTNGERLLRQFLRQESDVENQIKKFEGVDDANITYMAKDTSNSILAKNKTIAVTCLLSTNSKFDEDEAEAIASLCAAAVGNTDNKDVKVVDQKGKIIFNGEDIGKEKDIDFTDKFAVQGYFVNQMKKAVEAPLLLSGYSEVQASAYLDMNFDKVVEQLDEIIPLEGEENGVLMEYREQSSSGSGGNGDIPGTTSNDDTDYFITEGGGGSSETYSVERIYKPTERVRTTYYDTGSLNADKSSISVVATRVETKTERELKVLGLLEDMTFEEYALRNGGTFEEEANPAAITLISKATGIPEENVAFQSFVVRNFEPEEKGRADVTTIVQIALAVLLFAILLFVILRSLKPVEITEVEPELSIEQLLATTKENQGLEEVEFSEGSETRKMIEKFFDENPEAVAQLLRNWLNEEWM
ncbi:MAG: hypothetical protein IKS11_00330 [Lachnospiraceae bacterium]|nr:hypothetical protein [Lachnospiraceae bacterium]